MSQRGQGTIEYLVILAIIVVIALIVVGLLLQTTSVGGGIGESQSKTAWKSAEPFSIIDFSQSNPTTGDGNLSLVVKNNSGSVLHLNSVTVDGVALIETTTGENTVTNFAPNSTRVMTTGSPSTPCQQGNTFSYTASTIEFDYNTADISGRTQIGKSPLTGTCS
jgi:archaellum component FlaG (FlaF/FlaG flagellin family)